MLKSNENLTTIYDSKCINSLRILSKMSRNPNKDLTGQIFSKWTVLNGPIIKNNGKQNVAWWHCQCECGFKKNVRAALLLNGSSKGCQCRKNDGTSAKYKLYGKYRKVAKDRNLSFKLDENTFYNLTDKNCYYCNSSPSKTIKSMSTKYLYNGIDRIDNKLGYTIENTVTCCTTCNIAKNQLSQNDFFNLIKMIYERHLSAK